MKIRIKLSCFFCTFAPHLIRDLVLNPFTVQDMFEGLQKKWKVKGWQLALIIATFAIGGSATGYVAKKIMNILSIQQDWLWAVIYILLITVIWPLAVLLISIPFGQFPFFSRYIKKVGVKMGLGGSRESIVGSREPGARSQEP